MRRTAALLAVAILGCILCACRGISLAEESSGQRPAQEAAPRLVECEKVLGVMPQEIEFGWPFIISPDLNHVAWVETRVKWATFTRVIFMDGAEVKRYKTDSVSLLGIVGDTLFYEVSWPGKQSLFGEFKLGDKEPKEQKQEADSGGEEPATPFRDLQSVAENVTAATGASEPIHVSSSDGKSLVIANGIRGKEYDEIRGLVVIPKGSHFAYEARNGKKWRVVSDSGEGKEYNEIIEGTVTLSPDGKHVAYAARDYKTRWLVVDNVEVKQYDEFVESGVAFGPDSKRVACLARRYKSWVVWVDGAESKEYDSFLPVAPVFDGPNKLRYLALRGGRPRPVIIKVDAEIRDN